MYELVILLILLAIGRPASLTAVPLALILIARSCRFCRTRESFETTRATTWQDDAKHLIKSTKNLLLRLGGYTVSETYTSHTENFRKISSEMDELKKLINKIAQEI